eukprot:scaffold58689_cov63-Phaeocystis_antarctica.AAC.7
MPVARSCSAWHRASSHALRVRVRVRARLSVRVRARARLSVRVRVRARARVRGRWLRQLHACCCARDSDTHPAVTLARHLQPHAGLARRRPVVASVEHLGCVGLQLGMRRASGRLCVPRRQRQDELVELALHLAARTAAARAVEAPRTVAAARPNTALAAATAATASTAALMAAALSSAAALWALLVQ